MLLRAISGSIYVAVIVLCILGGARWFTLLMGVMGVIGISEVVKMITAGRRRSVLAEYADLAVFAAALIAIYIVTRTLDALPVIICFAIIALYIPVRMIIAVFQKDDALRQAVGAMFALIYVGMPTLMAATAFNFCNNPAAATHGTPVATLVMLVSFVLIWLNDTGAYLSGRTFGRTKLCERLSPKKTWEGFYGGFALCVIASVIFAAVSGYNMLVWGVYGAVVSIASTFGDLFESLIKRTCGVKDSGTLIPGHGGMLDRIDSFIAVAPLAASLCFFIYLI